MSRRLALMCFTTVPTTAQLLDLKCDWDWDKPMHTGTGDPMTANTIWGQPYVWGSTALALGFKHIVGYYDCVSEVDPVKALLIIQNLVQLSLYHSEIYGFALNDYYWAILNGHRTVAQVNQAIQYARIYNPALKINIAWLPAMSADIANADSYLSQIQYDEVYAQCRIGQNGLTATGYDAFLTYVEQHFPGKPIWGTLNFVKEDTTLMTVAEVQMVCEINQRHFDQGKILGMRVQNLEILNANPSYYTAIKQYYVDVVAPSIPLKVVPLIGSIIGGAFLTMIAKRGK